MGRPPLTIAGKEPVMIRTDGKQKGKTRDRTGPTVALAWLSPILGASPLGGALSESGQHEQADHTRENHANRLLVHLTRPPGFSKHTA